jgi:hypothetical protein
LFEHIQKPYVTTIWLFSDDSNATGSFGPKKRPLAIKGLHRLRSILTIQVSDSLKELNELIVYFSENSMKA